CPEVRDISSVAQLLSYAGIGQLAQLQRHLPDISQGRIAHAAGLGGNPRDAGAGPPPAMGKGLPGPQLKKPDEINGGSPPVTNGAGGLCSLALRLSAEGRGHDTSGLTAHIPPSWARSVLLGQPATEVDVLIQASALLAKLMAADKMEKAGRSVPSPRHRYAEEMEPLVQRLTLVSVAPPTSRNYDAQIMVGSRASYAFEPMSGNLESTLRYSPMGFRVWRAIAK